MDFFYFFFHLSLNILKERGICIFITTNYYITALGARKLRKDFKKRAILKKLINFNELKIFESAQGQHNLITILSKGHNETEKCNIINVHRKGMLDNSFYAIINKEDNNTIYSEIKQKDLYESEEDYIRLFKEESKSLLSQILNKMVIDVDYLGMHAVINKGFHTGCDKVTDNNLKQVNIKNLSIKKGDGIFVLNENEAKRFLKYEIVHKCYKCSDINKYNGDNSGFKNLYVIYTNKYTNIDKYIEIKKHLSKYRPFLELKREYKNGRLPWYSHHWAREEEIFTNNDKIVLPYRAKTNIFAYCTKQFYASEDVLFISKFSSNLKSKYILALLNSKLYYVWLYNNGKRKGDMLELYSKPLEELPIKIVSSEIQQKYINVIDKILNLTKQDDYLENIDKQNKVKEYEKQIDIMVYKLYELTYEEVLTIDKDFKLSKEDYNSFKLLKT